MKYFVLFVALYVPVVQAQFEFVLFQDERFEAALLTDKAINTNGDEKIDLQEAASVQELDLYGLEITDLTGVQEFPNLHTLDCSDNKLKELDISKNSHLSTLYCFDNEISELDVSKNKNLSGLMVSNNQLSSLDVSGNLQLKILNFSGNKLTRIDLSKNAKLTYLNCSGNHLKNLDVSNNKKIVDFYCFDNTIQLNLESFRRMRAPSSAQ